MTDLRHLLEDQYRDPTNLQDRTQLHAGFSVNPRGWPPWVFERFDGVIANHMLYHVPDRAQASGELRRVLRAGGHLYAATNGPTDGIGLRAWVRQALHQEDQRPQETTIDLFSLETRRTQLKGVFASVVTHRYEDAFEITEVEPLIAYVRSTGGTLANPDKLDELRDAATMEIERHGCLRLAKNAGTFEASGRAEPDSTMARHNREIP